MAVLREIEAAPSAQCRKWAPACRAPSQCIARQLGTFGLPQWHIRGASLATDKLAPRVCECRACGRRIGSYARAAVRRLDCRTLCLSALGDDSTWRFAVTDKPRPSVWRHSAQRFVPLQRHSRSRSAVSGPVPCCAPLAAGTSERSAGESLGSRATPPCAAPAVIPFASPAPAMLPRDVMSSPTTAGAVCGGIPPGSSHLSSAAATSVRPSVAPAAACPAVQVPTSPGAAPPRKRHRLLGKQAQPAFTTDLGEVVRRRQPIPPASSDRSPFALVTRRGRLCRIQRFRAMRRPGSVPA